MSRRVRAVLVAVAVAAGIMVSAAPASAETMTWQAEDGVPGFWSRSENWQPERAPVAGDDLVFPAGGHCGSNDITARLDLRSLTFRTHCNLNGERFGIGAGGLAVDAVPGSGAVLLLPITLVADQTWSAPVGEIFTTEPLDLAGHTLTLDSGGNVTVVGLVHGGGLVVKRGSGLLSVGSGTSTSKLDVHAGTVDLRAPWNAPVTLRGGTLRGPGPIGSLDAAGGTISLGNTNDGTPQTTVVSGQLTVRRNATVSVSHRSSRLTAAAVVLDEPVLDVAFATNRELVDGAVIRLVDNTGTAPVYGTFADLPERSVLTSPFGERFQVTYRGGDGNDVELRFLGSSDCSYPQPWPPSNVPVGYRLVASDGGVFTFGQHAFTAALVLSGGSPTVGIATPPTKVGYWVSRADASAAALAPGMGADGHGALATPKPIVGITSAPFCGGFWQVGADGGVYAFGRAQHHGGLEGRPLNQPIVGMATTATGRGYWLAARDGGVFSFGDATFFGSTGGMRLNQPIVGMAATPSGQGYWMVARDGGVFTFGDAVFHGSTGAIRLNQPIVGMATTPTGRGYWLVASDGGVFSFGDATFLGSTGNIKLNAPIVGIAA